MSFLLEFFNSIIAFINVGIFEGFETMLQHMTASFILKVLEFKLYMVQFSWGVAQQLITQLNLSTYINQAWSQVDQTLVGTLTYFRIPEGINLVLSAGITKFVLRFMNI